MFVNGPEHDPATRQSKAVVCVPHPDPPPPQPHDTASLVGTTSKVTHQYKRSHNKPPELYRHISGYLTDESIKVSVLFTNAAIYQYILLRICQRIFPFGYTDCAAQETRDRLSETFGDAVSPQFNFLRPIRPLFAPQIYCLLITYQTLNNEKKNKIMLLVNKREETKRERTLLFVWRFCYPTVVKG